MRLALPFAILLTVAACGDLTGGPAGSPRPSEVRTAVEPVAPLLAFQTLVPDELPSGYLQGVSLYAKASGPPTGADVLGEPILLIQWTVVAGGKPSFILVEGPADCCATSLPHGDRSITVIRPAAGGTREVSGEFVQPRGALEGLAVWWNEPTSAGRTFIAAMSTSFAPLDEQALLRIARSMRVVDKRAAGDTLLLYLSTHVSHSADGHRVFVAARTGPVPEEARLADAKGNIISTANFQRPATYDCLKAAAGVAAFAVSHDVVEKFGQTAGAGYRVEARVNGAWRPVQLVSSGCSSIE